MSATYCLFGKPIPAGMQMPSPLLFRAFIGFRVRERLGVSVQESIILARGIYQGYITDERIPFGHPDYDWSASAACEIADVAMSEW